MNIIEIGQFPHANMRDENGNAIPVSIVKGQVFSWYYSQASKATHVVAGAGAIVPLLVTPEEFQRILFGEEVRQEEQLKTELKQIEGAKK